MIGESWYQYWDILTVYVAYLITEILELLFWIGIFKTLAKTLLAVLWNPYVYEAL